MHSFINEKSKTLGASLTFEIAKRYLSRVRKGLPAYNLGIGEPDCPTPDIAKEAGKEAIDSDYTRYTATAGSPELRAVLQARYKERLGIHYNLDEIICSNGGKQVLFLAFQTLLSVGDEVLVCDPAWLSYIPQIEWSGAKAVKVNLDPNNHFRPKSSDYIDKITDRTKIIILNSPSNPAGGIMRQEEMQRLVDFIRDKNILIISDDVYEDFYFEEKPTHILEIAPELQDQVLIVNAVSKSYAMTGWRLGFGLGSSEIIGRMLALQAQVSSHPSSISQRAAQAALSSDLDLEPMRTRYRERRDLIMEWFKEKPHYKTVCPDGAFYIMIKLPEGKDDMEFCIDLINNTGVALVPGSGFGEVTKGYVRLAFASDVKTLKTAFDKLP